MCFVYPQRPSIGNFGYDRGSRHSSAEANQRLPSEYTTSTHNGINRKKRKEKGAKKSNGTLVVYAVSEWHFPKGDFASCLSVLIWLSPGPQEKPALMVLQSPFYSLIYSNIGGRLRVLLKARLLNLVLIIDPLARLHAREGKGW